MHVTIITGHITSHVLFLVSQISLTTFCGYSFIYVKIKSLAPNVDEKQLLLDLLYFLAAKIC